jgi:putative oxidoreductase
MFIVGGLDAARNPEGKVKAAEAATKPLTDLIPVLPQDTETLVRMNGVVQVGAGVLLAIGKFRRLAALALIGSIIPTTYAGHRFWEETDEATRKQQQVHFLKNLGLLGGLILAAFDTEGAPSLGWRARRQAERVSGAVSLGRAATESHAHRAAATLATAGSKAGHQASRTATDAAAAGRKAGRRAGRKANEAAGAGRKAGRKANKRAAEAGRHAQKVAARASHQANKAATQAGHKANSAVADAAKSGLTLAAPYVRHAAESAQDAAKTGVAFATPYVRQANESAHGAAKSALDGAEHYLSVGADRAGDLLTKASDHLPG